MEKVIGISFSIAAESPPSDADRDALRETMASQMGIPVSSFKHFSVEVSRRRLAPFSAQATDMAQPDDVFDSHVPKDADATQRSESHYMRRLDVEWSVSCDIATDLSDFEGSTDAAAEASLNFALVLTSADFSDAVVLIDHCF